MTNTPENFVLENAADIIERFGGIRPMAAKMGIPVTTVQGWKKRNVIPGNRLDDVLQAAANNNIHLDDLVGDAVAPVDVRASSQNNNDKIKSSKVDLEKNIEKNDTVVLSAPVPFSKKNEELQNNDNASFAKNVDKAARFSSDDTKHDAAVAAGRLTAVQDDMMRSIRAAEKRAVRTSSFMNILLITAACGLGAFLLWPTHQQVQSHDQRLVVVEENVAEIKRGGGFINNLIPDDLKSTLGNLKDQAAQIQGVVAQATKEAENISQSLLKQPDYEEMKQRLAQLEQQVQQYAAVNNIDLPALISRFTHLQDSEEGQNVIGQSIIDINKLIASFNGQVTGINEALIEARETNPALAQSFEGVSETDMKAAALLMGLTHFRSSMNRKAPFQEDLLLLKNFVGSEDVALNESIEKLSPFAEKGILSPAGLSTEFKGIAGDIVVSSLKGEDVSLQEKAKARLNEILQVQKDGELITGTDTQSTVARAQKLLDEGDVSGAIVLLQTLQGDAAVTAKPFIDEATATKEALLLKDVLTDKVLTQLQSMSATQDGSSFVIPLDLKAFLSELDTRKVISSPDNNIKFLAPAQTKVPMP
jgi:hypothetical protein